MEKVRMVAAMGGLGVSSHQSGSGDDTDLMDSTNCCKMSKKNKLIAFASFLGFGILLSMMSMTMLMLPTKFAVAYSFGNIFAMSSTMFLVGPMRQLKSMCGPDRWIACLIYFLSLGFALFSALKLQNFFLTIFSIIIEMCAITWYTLSYIPFARSMVKSCFRSIWGG